ncbi:hypothetical protein, partial [Hymenobacter arizonensis]
MHQVKDYPWGLVIADDRAGIPATCTVPLDGDELVVDVEALLATHWAGGNEGAGREVLQRFVPLGQYTKAPCGGFVNCFRVRSARGRTYYLYSGVNEVSNSCFVATLHSVWEDEDLGNKP